MGNIRSDPKQLTVYDFMSNRELTKEIKILEGKRQLRKRIETLETIIMMQEILIELKQEIIEKNFKKESEN